MDEGLFTFTGAQGDPQTAASVQSPTPAWGITSWKLQRWSPPTPSVTLPLPRMAVLCPEVSCTQHLGRSSVHTPPLSVGLPSWNTMARKRLAWMALAGCFRSSVVWLGMPHQPLTSSTSDPEPEPPLPPVHAPISKSSVFLAWGRDKGGPNPCSWHRFCLKKKQTNRKLKTD